MSILPELKKGDVLSAPADKKPNFVVVHHITRGNKYDEPIYKLVGRYGKILKGEYTLEQIASWGYTLEFRPGDEQIPGK